MPDGGVAAEDDGGALTRGSALVRRLPRDRAPRWARARPARTAVAFATAFALTYLIAVGTWEGQVVDSAAFRALASVHDATAAGAAWFRAVMPVAMALVAMAMAAAALFSRRWLDVVRAAVMVAGSVVACEALKALLPRPDLGPHGYHDNTFPSGHLAFALSAALATGVVAVHRWWAQVIFAVSLACALGLAWASITTYAHRPSDVVGAALLVGAVASLALWGRAPVARRRPTLAVSLCLLAAWAVASVIVGGQLENTFPLVPELRVVETVGWLLACAAAIGFVVFMAPRALPGRLQGGTDSLRAPTAVDSRCAVSRQRWW